MSAIADRIIRRARFLAAIRDFFAARGVWEVDTAQLRAYAVSDPALRSLAADDGWLITSPEYAMKTLLCHGAPDIYQLSHVFRGEEHGRRHRREFMLLEWYRLGYDHHALIQETAALIRTLLPQRTLPLVITPYAELFRRHLQLEIDRSDTESLRRHCADIVPESRTWQLARSACLDLLFTHVVEAQLGRDCLQFVTAYPAEQAALARIETDAQGRCVAARFEAYIDGVELCNGFHELGDAAEQRRRFAADNVERRILGLPTISADEDFLQALERGLPDCAGVALGVDRLLMLAAEESDIGAVMLP